jgi:hypothetical protein
MLKSALDMKFARYHFSATLHTSDAAVLHCLIGMSQWAQRGEKYPQIAWSGCGEKDWRNRGGRATFHFTSAERRAEWHAKAAELLSGKWTLIAMSDNDAAFPPPNRYPGRQMNYVSGIPVMRPSVADRSVH